MKIKPSQMLHFLENVFLKSLFIKMFHNNVKSYYVVDVVDTADTFKKNQTIISETD